MWIKTRCSFRKHKRKLKNVWRGINIRPKKKREERKSESEPERTKKRNCAVENYV